MSCDRNGVKGTAAAGATGISKLTSKFVSVAGVALTSCEQAADTAAQVAGRTLTPLSQRVLQKVDRPATAVAAAAPYLAALAVMTAFRLYTFGPGPDGSRQAPELGFVLKVDPGSWRTAKALVKSALLTRALKGGSAKILGDLATFTQKEGGQRTLVSTRKGLPSLVPALLGIGPVAAKGLGPELVQPRAFKLPGSAQEVQFVKSRLTPFFNRQDLLVSRNHLIASEGELVRTQAMKLNPLARGPLTQSHLTWHRGTTVLSLPAGKGIFQERTLTHLRSLSLPSQSFYFERALSDEEVAGIVSGQGKKPQQLAGYAGTIGEAESLLRGWADLKRVMILARLHWPPTAAQWVPVNPEEPLSLQEVLSHRTKSRTATQRAILQDIGQLIAGRGRNSQSQRGSRGGFGRPPAAEREPGELLDPAGVIEGEKAVIGEAPRP